MFANLFRRFNENVKEEPLSQVNVSIEILDLISLDVKANLGENLVRYSIYQEKENITVRAAIFHYDSGYRTKKFLPALLTYNFNGEQIEKKFYGFKDTHNYSNLFEWVDYGNKPYLRKTEMWEDTDFKRSKV